MHDYNDIKLYDTADEARAAAAALLAQLPGGLLASERVAQCALGVLAEP